MLRIFRAPRHVVSVSMIGAFINSKLCVYTGREASYALPFGAPPTRNPADKMGNRPTFHQKVDGVVEYPPDRIEINHRTYLGVPWVSEVAHYGATVVDTGWCDAIGRGSLSYSPQYYHHSSTVHGQYSISIGTVVGDSVPITVSIPGFTWKWPGWKTWSTAGATGNFVASVGERTSTFELKYPTPNPNGTGVGPASGVSIRVWIYKCPDIADKRADLAWSMYMNTPPDAVLLSQFLLVEHAQALIYNKLIGMALSKMKLVNINSLAYLRDAVGLVNRFRHVKKELKRFLRQPTRKKLSNLWLNARYGLPLFVEDSNKILRAARKTRSESRIQKFSASYTTNLLTDPYTIRCELHLTIYVQRISRQEMSLTQSLLLLDLFPTAQNVWDLIPYSFVADWILDIGEKLEPLDRGLMLLEFPILGAVASVKLTTPLSSRDPFSSRGDITTYKRLCLSAPDLTRLPSTIDASVGDGLSLKHGVDALALVVQRK